MTELLAHSPLGASGASRWMPCPGSVGLSYGVEDDDDEFAGPGKAAHAVAAECLRQSDMDAWEWIGWQVAPTGALLAPETGQKQARLVGGGDPIRVNKEMADAVQVYLDAIRATHPDRNQGNSWIERRFHCPDIHEYFYGTSDLTVVEGRTLHVWDYKHGAGIIIEVPNNVQCMYYACGMLEDLGLWNKIDKVTLHIVQPRGFHFDGPIRSWSVSTADLDAWLWEVLIPAMDHALVSNDTASGEHCRFCPARRRKCPQLMADLDELEVLVNQLKTAGKLTAAETGRILTLMVPAMIARKQALKNATGMLNAGHKVPGWKLAKARSNRKFKDGALDAAMEKFGGQALTTSELKSPAQIEGLPEGEAFTTRWAFKPEAGLTVVPETDIRAPVSKDTKSMFKSKKGKK